MTTNKEGSLTRRGSWKTWTVSIAFVILVISLFAAVRQCDVEQGLRYAGQGEFDQALAREKTALAESEKQIESLTRENETLAAAAEQTRQEANRLEEQAADIQVTPYDTLTNLNAALGEWKENYQKLEVKFNATSLALDKMKLSYAQMQNAWQLASEKLVEEYKNKIKILENQVTILTVARSAYAASLEEKNREKIFITVGPYAGVGMDGRITTGLSLSIGWKLAAVRLPKFFKLGVL